MTAEILPDKSISLLKMISILEKEKGFNISQNRISYLNPKYNCYEFCWCRNMTEDNVFIPEEVYKQKDGSNLVQTSSTNFNVFLGDH